MGGGVFDLVISRRIIPVFFFYFSLKGLLVYFSGLLDRIDRHRLKPAVLRWVKTENITYTGSITFFIFFIVFLLLLLFLVCLLLLLLLLGFFLGGGCGVGGCFVGFLFVWFVFFFFCFLVLFSF